ncbi:CLUMA_CG013050, isoform A [Clunio marinus]|uniref:CLUMA_CG013050, isoform A n=1 Tax=Clunio marinus TaxID=568069 RepID=A0A1J1IJL2_9DIPT|nr:CLUMA_CG013050, isoform A [Clunio marinus]
MTVLAMTVDKQQCKKRVRRFGFGPLCAFILLALLGFVFFITSLVMIWINSDDVNKFLNDKFKSNLKIQLSHLPPPPKISYTMEKPNKKGKSRVKMGFLAIYVCLCIVSGLIYLAYKELEDFLENQQKEQEKENEIIITISHIT